MPLGSSDHSRLSPFITDQSKTDTFTQLILLLTIMQGIAVAGYILLFPSTQAGDFQAFYFAAERVLSGEPFVGRSPPTGVSTAWVFAPINVIYFLPFAVLPSWQIAYAIQFGVILLLLISTALLLQNHFLSESDSVTTSVLFILAVVCNPFTIQNFAQGQMNAHLLFLIVLSFIWIKEGDSSKGGVVLGISAILKLWPMLLGIWLIYRQDWKAVVSAVCTGISGIVAGVLLLGPDTTMMWATEVLTTRSRIAKLSGGVSPNSTMVSIQRIMAVILPGMSILLYTLAGLAIGALFLAIVYQHSPVGENSFAVGGTTACVALLVLPAATFPYLLMPLTTGLTLFVNQSYYKTKFLLSSGVLIAGVPVGLEELVALSARLGIPIYSKSALSFFFSATPPFIIGLVLLTIGHAISSITTE